MDNKAYIIMNHIDNMEGASTLSPSCEESFCKVILSAFLYLNSEFSQLYPDFNSFWQVIKRNVVNIKFTPVIDRDKSTLGKHTKDTIFLKESLKSGNSSFLIKIFAHELTHAISYGSCSIGIIPKGILQNIKYHYLNELETEYLSIKFLEAVFYNNLTPLNYEKVLYHKREVFSLNYSYTGTTYPSLSVYANILNYLFGKELCRIYLTDGMSLNTLFSTEKYSYLSSDFLIIEKAYKQFMHWRNIRKYKSTEQFPFRYYDKMYNHISHMVLSFLRNNHLCDSDYQTLVNIIMETPIYITNNEKSLNKMEKYRLS